MDLIEELAKRKLQVPKLVNYPLAPDAEDNPYDSMGRGMSPQTALRLEALGNRFAYPGKYNSLIQEGVYPVRPDFVNPGWQGGGEYEFTGSNEGKIAINIDRPWWGQHSDDSMEDIIAHEKRHREMGNMGGVISETPRDKMIRSYESEAWRLPGERYAYGGNEVLLGDTKYYLPGDFQRILQGKRISAKSK